MLEVIYNLAFGLLGGSIGGLMTYVIIKRKFSTDAILQIFEELLAETTENVELQKKIYIVGGILGQGIKQGIGLSGKGGSTKFSIEGLIGQFVQRYLFKGQGGESEPAAASLP